MKKLFIFLAVIFLIGLAGGVLAHQPKIIFYQKGDISVQTPEVSQAFYDELTGNPRNYFINSGKDFVLYLNILVPEIENPNGRYSAQEIGRAHV